MSNTELSFASSDEEGALNVTVNPIPETVARRIPAQASRRQVQEGRGSVGAGANVTVRTVNLHRVPRGRQSETINRRNVDEIMNKIKLVSIKTDRIIDLLNHLLERHNGHNHGTMAWNNNPTPPYRG